LKLTGVLFFQLLKVDSLGKRWGIKGKNGKYIPANEKDVGEILKACLKDEYKVEMLDSTANCLEEFNKRRYEFLFIDILFITHY